MAFRKYSVDFKFFDKPNLINSYWAGFIAADGNIRTNGSYNHVNIGLAVKDKNHLESFAKDCKYNGPIKIRKCRNYLSSHIEICGVSEWTNSLNVNFNVTSKKSLTLKPPLILNYQNSLAFICGIIDGDGTIGLYNDRLSISILGTKELLEWIKNIFDSIIPPRINHNSGVRQEHKGRNSKVFCYKISGVRAQKIADILLSISVPRLERKWSKVNLAIKPKYNSEFWNIKTDYRRNS